MTDDITHAEAVRDAEHEKHEREQEAWKAKIIGSPIELSQVIYSADNELWINILRNIAHLAEYGLEFRGLSRLAPPHLERPYEHKDLREQTIDEVVELSKHIQQAIEEHVNG